MLSDRPFDSSQLIDARTELLCARLYLRAVKHRVEKGFRPHDMAAFYNSVFFGMRYYIVKHKGCDVFVKDHELTEIA